MSWAWYTTLHILSKYLEGWKKQWNSALLSAKCCCFMQEPSEIWTILSWAAWKCMWFTWVCVRTIVPSPTPSMYRNATWLYQMIIYSPPDYTVDTNHPCFSQDHPSNNYGRDLLDLCWASRIHLVSISSERLGMWSERLTIWLLLRPQSNRPHLHFKCGC